MMLFTRFKKVLQRQVSSLNSLEALVLWIRLASTLLMIILGIVLVVGPISSPKFLSMASFSTKPSDITQGLLEELKEAVEVLGSTDVNSGVGLTTSEILILTDYTAKKVQSLPQYITITLYGRCDISFTTAEVVKVIDDNPTVTFERNSSITENCQMSNPSYIFDYREILSQLSLDIVLDYAYDKDLLSPLGKSVAYTDYIQSLRGRKRSSMHLLYLVISLEVLVLGFTIWYYSIKGRSINPLTERILSHVLSLLSIIIFICGLVCIINLAWITYSLQRRITDELQVFGFSFNIGKPWFACLWFFTFFILLSTAFWSGLEWCISNVQKPFDDQSRDNILEYNAGVITGLTDLHSPSPSAYRDSFQSVGRDAEVSSMRHLTTNEEHEMQYISPIHSAESDIFYHKSLKPSSTMHF